ncbi:UDP-N-acetylmuramoylalanyl-D-glutamate--2,6-diaminopimelate ligase [Paenibacillus swuensis]|uniref:UDP-N-acetylmuramoyl-L-alanyl-D-glutamate--2,6-diaminopimelate ligase n=1 Tax=Paenibacillus swuensis TaxID=1178515 RepID=A0A172TK72_9BACL|nr:UDP-N-acetylmuramoyl-L-alanyl-D-glutamate--2,6-diaminopimelate ligase [Paenibacillus swuensis]ANE47366.1 UDP-N-acetylmuramoylalanyl-D-glutamate--2,6-diaminopimelate ligase [Paenibacillus swuensis]
MQLKELASLVMISQVSGDEQVQITGIQTDSRKVQQGDLFICLPGHTVNGHDYAEKAVASGAAALVIQEDIKDLKVPVVKVKDTRFAMAVMADHFYGHPSSRLKLIGVTGTNGKTTTTFLIDRILEDQGKRTGLIGTIKMKIADQFYEMSGTTPEALQLQQHLHEMVEADTDYCIMEVSSHALEQGRVKGSDFKTAIFTNLTQDHLDYHGTMREYLGAKGLFFSRLGNTYSGNENERRYAVLNADDQASETFAKLTSAEVITYAIDSHADLKASDIRITSRGTTFKVNTPIGESEIALRMVGKFNVYNALAAMSAGLIEGISLEDLKASLEAVQGVDGRVETVDEGQSFAVIVDYAHTPDGLENVLATVKEFAEGKVLCVFGCGGDRDRTKRPLMGKIAAKYADRILVTSDNPRSENPDAILLDIEAGLTEDGVSRERYELIVDRKTAIEKAIEMASPDDVVLIAGKGHETYQIMNGVTIDFDDRLVAKEALRGRVQ